MFKRLLAKLTAFLGPIMCSHGHHRWAYLDNQPSTRYCTRPGCTIAQQRSSGLWVNFKRQEVTLEQVQKLNRHERRRLCALARQGAFGRIPE